jgi:hypothetical protein
MGQKCQKIPSTPKNVRKTDFYFLLWVFEGTFDDSPIKDEYYMNCVFSSLTANIALPNSLAGVFANQLRGKQLHPRVASICRA